MYRQAKLFIQNHIQNTSSRSRYWPYCPMPQIMTCEQKTIFPFVPMKSLWFIIFRKCRQKVKKLHKCYMQIRERIKNQNKIWMESWKIFWFCETGRSKNLKHFSIKMDLHWTLENYLLLDQFYIWTDNGALPLLTAVKLCVREAQWKGMEGNSFTLAQLSSGRRNGNVCGAEHCHRRSVFQTDMNWLEGHTVRIC